MVDTFHGKAELPAMHLGRYEHVGKRGIGETGRGFGGVFHKGPVVRRVQIDNTFGADDLG